MNKILVIDDEQQILDLVWKVLSKYGFNVEIASGGKEGLDKFDDGAFDLVITDIRMNGIDGKQVLNHIRNSNKPETPVIGFSGTPWLLENGNFDIVLTKPFFIKDIVHAVQQLSS
jgi:CheY-like chemotaxis protein